MPMRIRSITEQMRARAHRSLRMSFDSIVADGDRATGYVVIAVGRRPDGRAVFWWNREAEDAIDVECALARLQRLVQDDALRQAGESEPEGGV